MSESSDKKISRRNFLGILSVSAGATLLGKNISEKKKAPQTLESLNPDELIFSNSKIELKASSFPGIIDIIDKRTNKLINNLVLLVSWQDSSEVHYNNSEIQANHILISREETPNLIYNFETEESSPAHQPASGLSIELQLSDDNGRINIQPQIKTNQNNLSDIKIGIGCFFGINQGVNQADIHFQSQHRNVQPNIDSDTGLGELGNFESYEQAQGFTLRSAYPDMPNITLTLEPSSYGTVDIESRNIPYKEEHQELHENYTRQTEQSEWIEAGILYARPNQAFILNLN